MAPNKMPLAAAAFLLFAFLLAGNSFADPQMKISSLKMTALDGPFAGQVLSDISLPSSNRCPTQFAIGQSTRVRIDETVQNTGSDPTANARIYFTWGSPGPLLLDCSAPNSRDILNQRFCASGETKNYSFECTLNYSKYFAPSSNPKNIGAYAYASNGSNAGAGTATLCYRTTTENSEYSLISKTQAVSSDSGIVAAGGSFNLGDNLHYAINYVNNGNIPVCIKRIPGILYNEGSNAYHYDSHPEVSFVLQPNESKSFTENFMVKAQGTLATYDFHYEYFEDCQERLPVQNTVYYAGYQRFNVNGGAFANITAAYPGDNFWYVTGKPFSFNVSVKNTGSEDFTESNPLLVKLYFFKSGKSAPVAMRTKSVSLANGQSTTVKFVEPNVADLYFTSTIMASAEFDPSKYDWPVRGPQMTGYLQNSFSRMQVALPIPNIISSNNSKEIFLTKTGGSSETVPLAISNPSFGAQSFSLSASASNLLVSKPSVSLQAATCGDYSSDSSATVKVTAPSKAGYYSYLVTAKSKTDSSLTDYLKINVRVLPASCAAQSGKICSQSQNCDGTPMPASDEGLCCVGKCVANSGTVSFSVAASSVAAKTVFTVFADYTKKIAEVLETNNYGPIVFEKSGTNVCVVQEKCTNGVDDDLDGKIDCADSDCAENNACNGAKCDPGTKACVVGGTGAFCITNGSCESGVTHLACQNSACVVVAGEGRDLCSVNGDCTGKTQVCNNAACVLVDGTGVSECYSDSDCGKQVGRCNADLSACQVAGSGPLCTQSSSCTSNSHGVCSNDSCVSIIGAAGNQCDASGTCVAKHADCVNNACTLVNGYGEARCLSNPQCVDPLKTHSICSNEACVQVYGEGTNQCSANSDCVEKHAACVGSACVLVEGSGQATCHSSDDCSRNTHSVCSNDSCQIGIGPGANQCSDDAECINKHAACDGEACVLADGFGSAECVSDADCGAPSNAPDLFISDVKVNDVKFENGKIVSASVEFAVKNNGKPLNSDFTVGLFSDRLKFSPAPKRQFAVSGAKRQALSDTSAEARFSDDSLAEDDFKNEINADKRSEINSCTDSGGEWFGGECHSATEIEACNALPGKEWLSGKCRDKESTDGESGGVYGSGNGDYGNGDGSGNGFGSGGYTGYGTGGTGNGYGSGGDNGTGGGGDNGLGSIYGKEAEGVSGTGNGQTIHFAGVVRFQAQDVQFEYSTILVIFADSGNHIAESNENNNVYELSFDPVTGEVCGDGADNNGNGIIDEGCPKNFGMCISRACVPAAQANWDGISNFDTDGLGCSSGVQCSEGSHTVCSNNACILVAGADDDLCAMNSDCLGKHAACEDSACVLVDGFGEAECLSNKDCGELPASEGIAVDLKSTVPIGESQELTVFVKGQPAENALVLVVSPSSKELSFSTTADGKVNFLVKEEGTYKLTIKKNDLTAKPTFAGVALLSAFAGTISDSAKILLGKAATEAPLLALLLLSLSLVAGVLSFVVFKRLFELKVVSRREENKRLLIRAMLALLFFVAPLAANLVLGILFGIIFSIIELGIMFLLDNYFKKSGAIVRIKV